jgi:hypothetical protein
VKHLNAFGQQILHNKMTQLMAIAAHVARNDLTMRCNRNLWRGNFSKVIAFFKVKTLSVLVQQGDLGGNVSVKIYFNKFNNSI